MGIELRDGLSMADWRIGCKPGFLHGPELR
ncbi:hypothetical protein HNR29_004886 [Rhizobium leguminosarum]|nr:hypothetical protein [Rhizobium leguminosarum]